MEINERMKEVLQVQLSPLGLELKPENRFPLTVLHDDQPIAYIQEDGAVHYPVDLDTTPARRIPGVIAKVWEMEQAYRQAPQLECSGVNSYKKILQYNQHLLAARYDGNGHFRFVTWQVNFDQTGVTLGHYFYRNEYEQAKEDFIKRSGLVDERKLFSKEQLSILYSALLYSRFHDINLDYADKQEIDQLIRHIEAVAPVSQTVRQPASDCELDYER
ncbi:hypothetical protein KM924_01285 [Brevibacillus parabrevis]|uniref:hypothetical protein n=1 Tax=Brevibacillus parabrevis TaxID=54914 RepID=UPI001C24E0EB|nr:hypothetical protein [Brevibacillus parabrevis]MBU8711124.1 hypothetical protein [Brevibacillus parabrevis]